MQLGKEGGQQSHPYNTLFDWEVPFHTPCQQKVWLSGLLTHPITPYYHLNKGITVLY